MPEQPQARTSGTPHLSLIVCAFPATGKSFQAERHPLALLDSDSSAYSWKWYGPEDRRRHPDWPSNYISHLTREAKDGRSVLCSTHQEVRDALASSNIPFVLVYPRADLRADYVSRITDRASVALDAEDSAFQAWLAQKVGAEWYSMVRSCQQQEGCAHVVLGPGEYLRWPL